MIKDCSIVSNMKENCDFKMPPFEKKLKVKHSNICDKLEYFKYIWPIRKWT